ncbi:hypothetical protein [Streptomyces hokutonensis]|uniref:hypothetical protein n=1 Tax=Streptomyces hokutonensis TaxID=1306990 RepID=UPI0036856A0E
MTSAGRSGPPTLIVRSPDAVARLTAEGVVWEERATVTRIPYLAVVRAAAEPVGARRVRLRIELADGARGRPGGYELVCGGRSAQTFVRAVLAQRAARPAADAVPSVTEEPHAAAPPARRTRGELGFRVLVGVVVLNFLAVLATGRFTAAVLSCFGFFAWWGCVDLAGHVISVARDPWAFLTRGVEVEADYVRSEMRPGSSGRMARTWVYRYTGLDGQESEYLTGPLLRGSKPPPTRTVTVAPGSKQGARSRADAGFTLLILLPALLLGLTVVGTAALVAIPGVLLWGIG